MSQVDLAALNAANPVWRSPKAGIYIWPTAPDTGTFAQADGQAKGIPLPIADRTAVDRIACEVTSAGTTGAVVRLGIYEDNGENNPGALLVDAGTVDATTTGVKELTISQTLEPGLYWLVAVNQGTPSTTPVLRYAASQAVPFLTDEVVNFTSPSTHCVVSNTMTGALPDPFGSSTRGTNPMLVALRTA